MGRADRDAPQTGCVNRHIQTAPLGLAAALAVALCCLLPFFLQGNPFAPDLIDYWLFGGGAALVVGVLAARLPYAPIRELPARVGRLILRPCPLAFAVMLTLIATALSLVFVVRAYDSGASTSDEVAQLWHAKMLAHGWLSLPADPNPEFFAIDNVIDTGRWYSQFPIGGPLALAAGVLVGLPFLVNPVCAGLAAGAFSHFARVAFGELEGRVAALLFAVTPNILMMSGTYMNHVPVLFLATAALAMLAEWDRAGSPKRGMAWAVGIGVALGAAATIRPLDALILAVVIGVFQLRSVVRDPRRARNLVAQAIAGTVAVAPLLYANHVTNGSAFRFGYDVMWGPGHGIGFHPDPQGGVHTASRGILYALTYVNELNIALMSWPVPAMLVAFVGLAAVRKVTRWDALMIGFFSLQVAGYAAYWGRGEFLGPRFLFTAFPALVVILARTPFRVAEYEGTAAGRGMAAFITVCCLIAWGPSASKYTVWGTTRAVAASRRTLRVDVLGAVRSAGVHNALVFVREAFPARLLRRLWGSGVTRGDAVTLMATRDACSLVAAVGLADADPTLARGPEKARFIDSAATHLPVGATFGGAHEPQARVASQASLTPACLAEADDSKFEPGSFGAALPLESIGPDGHLGGDVIYAMDLGAHNEVLRRRFGDRAWYRLALSESSGGQLTARVVPY